MKQAWTLMGIALMATLGCGGSAQEPSSAAEVQQPAEGATPGASTPAAASAAPAIPDKWHADMTAEQKGEFMKQKIVPAMEPLFKGFYPSETFGCATCHGPDFKLPKDFLPHLTFKDNNLTAFTEDAEVAKFMAEKVTPTMASALGMAPYDPATQQGFGCGGCHAIDMK
jgi:hypothetical protein